MPDEFQAHFPWIAGLLERPISDVFPSGSTEHAVLVDLRDQWGRLDTVEVLRGLTERYGTVAQRALATFLQVNIRRDWAEIGATEAHEGTELDDLIRVLWEPIEGLEYTVERTPESAAYRVTRCAVHDPAERTGMHDWLYELSCATDHHTAPAFCPRIRFSRTRTLMRGAEYCDHQYCLDVQPPATTGT